MKTQNCKLEVVVTAHYNYYGQYAIQALLGMCKVSCSILFIAVRSVLCMHCQSRSKLIHLYWYGHASGGSPPVKNLIDSISIWYDLGNAAY